MPAMINRIFHLICIPSVYQSRVLPWAKGIRRPSGGFVSEWDAGMSTQSIENPHGRIRSVEGIEMQPSDSLIQKIIALFRGPLDADLLDSYGIILVFSNTFLQAGWKIGSSSQLGHTFHGAHTGDRHDPGNLRDFNTVQFALLAPVIEDPVVKEHLRRDPIST